MGIAGAIVVLAAGAFALLVLPSLLTVFGERIAAHTSSRRHALSAQDEAQTTGRWYRIATVVMRRPALWALSAVLILVVLAAPFLHVSFTGADASALPASSSAGTAYELVQSKFAAFSEAPASLVVDAAHPTARDLASLTRQGGSRSGSQGGFDLRAPRRLPVGVQRGPFLAPTVTGGPTDRQRPSVVARPGTAHRRGTDGLLLVAAEEPQVPPPSGPRADRPDRTGDALRHDALSRAPAHGSGDERLHHRRHLRHAGVGLPVGAPQPPARDSTARAPCSRRRSSSSSPWSSGSRPTTASSSSGG